MTILRRTAILVALACCTAVGAGEVGPRDFELEENLFLTGRFHDLLRSRERYQASAYGAFMNTRTGQFLAGQLVNGLEMVTDGQRQRYVDIAKRIKHLGYTLAVDPDRFETPDGSRFQAALGFDDAQPFLDLLGRFNVIQGVPGAEVPSFTVMGETGLLIERHADLLVMAIQNGGAKVHRTASPQAPLDGEACAEFLLDASPVMKGLMKSQLVQFMVPPAWQAFMKHFEATTAQLTARLAPCGLEERLTYAVPGWFGDVDLASLPQVDKAVFDGLPPTTIVAMAWQMDPRMVDLLLGKLPPDFTGGALAEQDAALAKEGLPGYVEILKSFQGLGMVYVESIGGKPAISLVLGVDGELGAKMAQAMNANLAGIANEPCPPEVVAVMGYEPKPAVACIDGELILTVHPNGIDGVTGRAGGFSQQPAVKEALGHVPAKATSMAVSNSPESWRFVGELILKIMDQDPQGAVMAQMVATLPEDLAASARYGYMVAQVNEGGTIAVDSAGMITPASGFTLGLGGLAGFGWAMRSQEVGPMGPDMVPEPPPAF